MSYGGWRTVTVVWLDGREEKIECLDEPWVRDGILHLKVSYDDERRHIPLTSIREWRATEYR